MAEIRGELDKARFDDFPLKTVPTNKEVFFYGLTMWEKQIL